MVVFGVLIIKFLPEKSFLSLEYLTIGEEVVFVVVESVGHRRISEGQWTPHYFVVGGDCGAERDEQVAEAEIVKRIDR